MLFKTKAMFASCLANDEDQINLAHAALLFAAYLSEAPDTSTYYLPLLDELAENIRPAIQAAETDLAMIEALNEYLFTDLKFLGNAESYYDPNNSFLNRVLELRMGIPISLSVVYLEIGWRLGLPLWGVGLPRHFIVGYGSAAEPIYIDVFNQGRILQEEDCLALSQLPLSRLPVDQADRLAFRQEFLRPAGKKAILSRMLLNLKQIYVGLEDWQAAHRTLDLMLIVQPDQVSELRDRGLIAYRLDRLHEATLDIQRYLFLAPDNPDAGWLKRHVELMEAKLIRLN